MSALSLDDFHGHWLPGFAFCNLAYQFFEQVKQGPDGVNRLRMRASETEKRLVEELLPICQFIQASARPGRNIEIQWLNGDQSHDGNYRQYGSLVIRGMTPAEGQLEVTTVVHPNDFLARETLAKGNPVFGVEGLTRSADRSIQSIPSIRTNMEFVDAFHAHVAKVLEKKASKGYQQGTILIMQLSLDVLYQEDEWQHLVGRVRSSLPPHPFAEIFLCEDLYLHRASILIESPRGPWR